MSRPERAGLLRLDEIYRYTRDRWGEAQAETYITGLFAFEQIETRGVVSRPDRPSSGWKGTASDSSAISCSGGGFPTATSAS